MAQENITVTVDADGEGGTYLELEIEGNPYRLKVNSALALTIQDVDEGGIYGPFAALDMLRVFDALKDEMNVRYGDYR